jgi:ATPase subunit of ABC transporter with duplicated ATPase domains
MDHVVFKRLFILYPMVTGGNHDKGFLIHFPDFQGGIKDTWSRISHSRFGHYLGRFNFKGADQQKRVGGLSGGERNRVHLAKLLRSGGNVLLLDEPTNDLDVETLRALEEALLTFPGCAAVISHDRWFLDRIATHILAFEGNSEVVWFEGNYQAYEEDFRRRRGEQAAQPHRLRYKPLQR